MSIISTFGFFGTIFRQGAFTISIIKKVNDFVKTILQIYQKDSYPGQGDGTQCPGSGPGLQYPLPQSSWLEQLDPSLQSGATERVSIADACSKAVDSENVGKVDELTRGQIHLKDQDIAHSALQSPLR